MNVIINRPEHDLIYVNDKMVRMDGDGNWIAIEELTPSETKALYEYINSQKLDLNNRLN